MRVYYTTGIAGCSPNLRKIYYVFTAPGGVAPQGIMATAETEFCGEPSISLSL